MSDQPNAPANQSSPRALSKKVEIPEKFIKSEKIEKLELKEKPEKFEHKEKPEKFEHKEKPEKFEHKEKPEKFEHKEKAEKFEKIEHKLEAKEIENKDFTAEGPLGNPGGPVEQRVAALERVVGSMQQHFITSQQRPDTSRGALASEPKDQAPKPSQS
jgi:hypothetical protein